jgi:peptide deformylase
MPKASGRLINQIRKDDPIVKYGDPVLRQIAKKVIFGAYEDLPEFTSRMLEIMYEARGVGLAAPQLGILLRVIVYDPGDSPRAIINPQIIKMSGEQLDPPEGCLSLPGLRGAVKRAYSIVCKGYDEHGKPIRIRAEDYEARIIQHETDHLDGVLFIDKAEKDSLEWISVDDEEEEGEESEEVVGTMEKTTAG